ncbi:MAG: PIN domain-containing protein [Candidatus Competibacteraceae bacterium]|nr:PIN domain-containing protein [Candidatus Competibacteraceae bacterium]MBK7985004.1 PIN domain-containing protein [Candidatus Competibacteraceae bacterium]MBK8895915.1 PIN domain-containing protein [Candidatus Competibacteraceae bacterium]MBK8963006.1 PIN domain-containing protein [Candidatus Competibacteraceae bacterium]MBK9953059.1 PIN domain-containing protein [Candidatus Competibacteraceae bacterium]
MTSNSLPHLPRARHGLRLWELIERSKSAGSMIYDARIAALCLEHGVTELWSADRDFSRFAPLKVRNPLAGSQ